MDLWITATGFLLLVLASVLAIGAYHLEIAVNADREREAQRKEEAMRRAETMTFTGYTARELSAISGQLLRRDRRNAKRREHWNIHGRTDNRFAA